LLIPAADHLITLTPGAAAAIKARWGRDATVLPHPHILDPDRIQQDRPTTDEFVVGVHVKSLRANMDPFPVLNCLAETVAGLEGAELQINLHDELFEPGNHWYAPDAGARLCSFARRPSVKVVVHPYFSDTELWSYLSSLTASVLPYRFGTHSGWLEACYDLGTAVIAPRCGFFHQQRCCETYDFTEHSFSPESLEQAVRSVYRRHRARVGQPRATWPQRRRERAGLAAFHRRLYEDALT
jgi:hypothetical protein